jgi:hypothetical protein
VPVAPLLENDITRDEQRQPLICFCPRNRFNAGDHWIDEIPLNATHREELFDFEAAFRKPDLTSLSYHCLKTSLFPTNGAVGQSLVTPKA